MAIGKKRKTRKTGAKKRKARVGKAPSPATVTVAGKTYRKKMCSLTKAAATKKAKTHRAKGTGKYAIVRKNTAGKGFCLYARG